MKQVEKAISPDNIIFVMDSSNRKQCYTQAEIFRNAVNLGVVIITKMKVLPEMEDHYRLLPLPKAPLSL